jgi:hypothetical protein
MRAVGAAAASLLGLFVPTVALLLLEPSAGFVLAAGLPLALVALAVTRVEWLPWLLVPTLSALTLWAFSAPGLYVIPAVGGVLGWSLLGIVVAIRRLRRTRASRRWRVTIATGVVVLSASLATMPLDLRFWLSEDAMNETALAVFRGERDPETVDRIGLWNVGLARRSPGGMRFTVAGAGFLSHAGFAYQADGLPPPQDGDTFRYWRRGWYVWTGGSS